MARKFPKIPKLIQRYRIEHGKKFRLKDFDPADTQGLDLKEEANQFLQDGIQRLSDMQQKLYAEDRWALLIVLQAMDSAGKDGVIQHVMSGLNPQGCQVSAFKKPSAEELGHDFLWRASKVLPKRGEIGIFNRSYYEETLIVRVHPSLLQEERIPPAVMTKRIWKERFDDINAFERYLGRNGTCVRKIFLNLSKEEQRRRFLARLEEPEKNWKFSEDDVREREHWDDYMRAYEDMIRHTASPDAPWFVVPADHKWFTRVVVASIVIEAMQSLKLAYPKVDGAKKAELESARKLLMQEGA
jgi:PPK2 family polyphosphate:nucleotide phosphotransferase